MLTYTGETCIDCESPLKFESKKLTKIIVYGINKTYVAETHVKVCFKENSLTKFFYNTSTTNPVFVSSNETAFETEFLRSFLSELFICPEYSFSQKATSFNLSIKSGNFWLHRKRLADAFFQYALLEMLRCYENQVDIPSLSFSFDTDLSLLKYQPVLREQFQKYHAEHRCETPGCGVVLGWDADCKVRAF